MSAGRPAVTVAAAYEPVGVDAVDEPGAGVGDHRRLERIEPAGRFSEQQFGSSHDWTLMVRFRRLPGSTTGGDEVSAHRPAGESGISTIDSWFG
jgi:hypothetical protein